MLPARRLWACVVTEAMNNSGKWRSRYLQYAWRWGHMLVPTCLRTNGSWPPACWAAACRVTPLFIAGFALEEVLGMATKCW